MLDFNFRKPQIAEAFKRNRYDIQNPDTLAHEEFKIITLDEGELAKDSSGNPIDEGYTVSEGTINTLVGAINEEIGGLQTQIDEVNESLGAKFGPLNPPSMLQAQLETFVNTVNDNTGDTAGNVRIILKSSGFSNGFGYIKYKYDLRSGTTLYPNCVSELTLIKLMDKVVVANLTSQGGYLKVSIPTHNNEVDIENNGAMYWTWKGIVEQKFIPFKV